MNKKEGMRSTYSWRASPRVCRLRLRHKPGGRTMAKPPRSHINFWGLGLPPTRADFVDTHFILT